MFTTSAIFTCETAPADALAAAPSSRAACPHSPTRPSPPQPLGTRRVDRPQDGADIVRVLDLVEDDEQRHAGGLDDEFFDAVAHRVVHVRDHALVRAAVCKPIELVRVRAADGDPLLLGG